MGKRGREWRYTKGQRGLGRKTVLCMFAKKESETCAIIASPQCTLSVLIYSIYMHTFQEADGRVQSILVRHLCVLLSQVSGQPDRVTAALST